MYSHPRPEKKLIRSHNLRPLPAGTHSREAEGQCTTERLAASTGALLHTTVQLSSVRAWARHLYAVSQTSNMQGLGPECAHSMKLPNNKEVTCACACGACAYAHKKLYSSESDSGKRLNRIPETLHNRVCRRPADSTEWRFGFREIYLSLINESSVCVSSVIPTKI